MKKIFYILLFLIFSISLTFMLLPKEKAKELTLEEKIIYSVDTFLLEDTIRVKSVENNMGLITIELNTDSVETSNKDTLKILTAIKDDLKPYDKVQFIFYFKNVRVISFNFTSDMVYDLDFKNLTSDDIPNVAKNYYKIEETD